MIATFAQSATSPIVGLFQQLGTAVGLLLLGAAGMVWVTKRTTKNGGAEQRILALVETLTTSHREYAAELRAIATILQGIVHEQQAYFVEGRTAMASIQGVAASVKTIAEAVPASRSTLRGRGPGPAQIPETA